MSGWLRTKGIWVALLLLVVIVAGWIANDVFRSDRIRQEMTSSEAVIKLPPPRHDGEMSVEEAIFRRRSVRRFAEESLTLAQVSQLLWAAGGKTIDGVTGATRSFPSAGGLYPFEIYLIVGRVTGLNVGIYKFQWRDHSLTLVKEGKFCDQLAVAAHRQGLVGQAAVNIIWVGDLDRVRQRYGERGVNRYISMDVGGAGQNVHLQAEALGLGTVIIGAFHDAMVQDILGTELLPLYIMPVG